MIRKTVSMLALFLMLGAANGFAQLELDLGDFDPDMIDPAQVDISDMEFYFHGPIEFFVTGVEHQGITYSAVLKYDGAHTVTVEEPPMLGIEDQLPAAIDLSSVSVSLTETGARLDNVLVDGHRFAGILAPTAVPTDLVVHSAWLEELNVLPSAARLAEMRDELHAQIGALQDEVAAQEDTIASQEQEIAQLEDTVAQQEDDLAARGRRIQRLESRIARLEDREVEIEDFHVDMIDPALADMSDAKLYFYEPDELLVTGVRYGGMTYSAVLEYVGGYTFNVREPRVLGIEDQLPASIDLTQVSMDVVEDGVRLDDVLVDGHSFSGILAPTGVGTEIALDAAWLQERDVLPTAVQLAEMRQELENEIAALERDLADRERTIADQQDEIARLEERAREVVVEEPAWQTAPEELTRVRLEGFDDGRPALGTWDTRRGRVSQTDAAQRFAKYEFSVRQAADEMLYTLEGEADGSGRRGYGLHFLASDVRNSERWGYGSSYLVWVTRDAAVYKTDDAYVHLYKSTHDGHMELLAGRKVPIDIERPHELQVYTDRDNQAITVSMEGRHLFTVDDADFLTTGSMAALRTLGSATFHTLQVTQ